MLSAVFISLSLPCMTRSAEAFTDQVIQHGAAGEDVIELQARLQYLGFYEDDIDGVFGWGTYWALRDFQDEFGMEVDGLAGSHAKEKLTDASDYDKDFVHGQLNKGNAFTYYGGKKNTNQSDTNSDTNNHNKAEPNASNVPQDYSQNDIQLMANAVHGEARGESFVGQVAVAAVILNRVENSSFPNSVSGVIFQPGAFTAVADGQIWLKPDETAKKAVLDAANGWDPSGHAIYYFNPKTATSDWIWSRPQIKQIGKHIFAK
ncbi:spore cortex-lytic enzyme [Lentibacillus kimchii]|uniref:Spore cortex-lytic enzyme n=1 Tax=Lentibacillus kimchii TaxID=1542911 RepID=A0ABW2V1P1_9BACI